FEVRLPADDRVTIAVYDLLGREVRTLADGPKAAGVYTVEWDGRDMNGLPAPSGVYLVRMKAGDYSAARKIVLMK
ncbi:MAG TPA: FlgD immunoglobulin-like domain containing protein, partial [Bacteroidota bacterium]|nr:FlgD immunoglobulin-like domain containing protein [Bacteroidota bacterium]